MTILVLDVGSSSARALLFDEDAHLIPGAVVVEKYEIQTEPPGAAILNMPALQEKVEACIEGILQHPAAQSIRAVGMDTLVGNLMGIDAQGQLITPIYTYADTRSAHDVQMLKRRVDAEVVHQRTGCLLHTAYHPARLHWLQRTEPDLFSRVEAWLDIGTYLYSQWFHKAPISYSVASWSGLLNRAQLEWDGGWLTLLSLAPDQFPVLDDYNTTVSGLTSDYAARWPLLRAVPFCLPIGDGVAANVGSGCVDRSFIALTVGTTAALRTITDEALPLVPAGLWSYRVNRQLHLLGGATSEGGNIFQWARETLIGLDDDMENALLECSPDSHGLTFLPLLAGERSPGWLPDATGAIIGLRLSTTPLDLLQAALEGVAHRLALIYEQLTHIANKDAQIVASGGALVASPAWTQMIANALNQPLYITSETELTARGTAILTLCTMTQRSLHEFPPTIRTEVEPAPEAAEQMRAARERQGSLYRLLSHNV
jgi:gluconokinase